MAWQCHETRRLILAMIEVHGGAYILPEQNRQPCPDMAIGSIHCRDVIGIGATEAAMQADWLAAAFATPAAATRPPGGAL